MCPASPPQAILENWFAAGLSRAECEATVASAQHGDFAVRLSSTKDKSVPPGCCCLGSDIWHAIVTNMLYGARASAARLRSLRSRSNNDILPGCLRFTRYVLVVHDRGEAFSYSITMTADQDFCFGGV